MDKIKSELLKDVEQNINKEEDTENKPLAPLKQVDELKQSRSEPGEGQIVIGGVPVDVFDIENLVIKVSPSDMKTLMRYDNARVIEKMRNTARPKLATLGETNWNLFFLLVIGGGVALMIFLFWDDIAGLFSGFF